MRAALFAHLWTKAPCPPAYVNMRMYREFGWTPQQLREQRAEDILDILTIWNVEAKVQEARGRK